MNATTPPPPLPRRPGPAPVARLVVEADGHRGPFGMEKRSIHPAWHADITGKPQWITSSHRDGRNHVITVVIRRKTNRRHMISDHHGRVTGIATLLLTATDGNIGTYNGSVVAVVVAGLEDLHLFAIGPVDQPVLIVDPA